ncbi:MAG TPA: response regulator transcription factor [Dehalococcoidia bacterium]|nr:response regulator transcription factor [Dehalococcoidia bacterium]
MRPGSPHSTHHRNRTPDPPELKLPVASSEPYSTGIGDQLDSLNLSRRELEVLTLISTGATNSEIAERFFISINTIQTHVSNILAKLNVSNRAEATAIGALAGLTGPRH